MPRKRHSTDEALLQVIVEDLQSESPHRYGAAIGALMSEGPLRCVAVLPTERPLERDDYAGSVALLAAELWAFVREMVRLRGAPEDRPVFGHGIWLMESMRLLGNSAGPHVTLGVEGTRRSVAILQLAFLVERVGLGNLRLCGVWDCQHVFVKTYRREFCSVQCQKRHYMRRLRANARRQQEQRRRRRQRVKGASA